MSDQTVSFTMHGIGVSGGIAIGQAHLFAGMSAEANHYEIVGADVQREQRRYDRAVKEVREELKELAESVRHSTSAELAPFVKVHLMLLDDAAFTEAPREIIRERHCNAEWALRMQLDELMAQFSDIEDPYLREREDDVRQVAERVLGALAGTERRMSMKAGARGRLRAGGARPLARRRDPLPRAPVRRVHHRPGRRHVAHRDRRALDEHPRDRGAAPLAHHDPRGRARDRRRHPGRGDRQSRQARARRVQAQAEPGAARARQAQAHPHRARLHARRHADPAASPTSSCRATWSR